MFLYHRLEEDAYVDKWEWFYKNVFISCGSVGKLYQYCNMALYIHPENQKLIWSAIQTSPLFNHENENAEWFKTVIQTFYEKAINQETNMTSSQLRDMNMDTILYMVRDLKSKKHLRELQTENESRSVDHFLNSQDPPLTLESVNREEKQPLSYNINYDHAVREADVRNATKMNEQTAEMTTRRNHDMQTGQRAKGLQQLTQKVASLPDEFGDTMPPFMFTQDINTKLLEENRVIAYPENSSIVKGAHPFYAKYHDEPFIPPKSSLDVDKVWSPPKQKEEIYRRDEHELVSRNKGGQFLNPLNTPILTKCLNIDTRFRDNLYTTSSSDFTFNLPTTIKKVISMQLSAYELPITFYGLSASYGNNFIPITCSYVDNNATTVLATKIITVEDGNYSASDLINIINTGLRPLNADGTLQVSDSTDPNFIFNFIQFTFDITATGSGSAKLKLAPQDTVGLVVIPGTISAASIQEIMLDFNLGINGLTDNQPITSKLGWNLGYIKPVYVGKKEYISDTLPEPASMRYLYLVVNDFNNSVNNHFVGAFNNWILNNNILARIPVTAQYFNILMENDLTQHSEPRKYFGPVDIQRLQLQLLDDHGRVLNMNGANYSMCLIFKTLNEY